MTKKPSLTINAISSWANLAVTLITTFLLTPFIISKLGKNGYGIWTLIGSFAGYYGLLNLGVSSAITRYIAKYSGSKDADSLNQTSSTAITMFSCTGLIVIILSYLLAEPIAVYFKVAPEKTQIFITVVRLLGLSTGLSFPGSVFGSTLTAIEKFVPVNIANITSCLIRAGLTVYTLNHDMGLKGIAYATLASAIFLMITNFAICRSLCPKIKFNPLFAKRAMLWTLLTYGGITTIITVANMLRTGIDSLVIGKFISFDAVGVYGIAALIIRYMVRLIITGMGVLTPRFANLHGSNNHHEIKNLFIKAIFVSSLITCAAGTGTIILGEQFILLWVGPEFKMAATILLILIFAWITDLAQNPGIGLMFALKKHHFYALAIIIEAVANLILSIILAPIYGVIGVAIGTLVPMILIRIFVQPLYVIKIVDLKLSRYLKTFIIPFTSMFITIFLFYFISAFKQWTMINYFNLAIGAAVISITYLFITKIIAMIFPLSIDTNGLLKLLLGSKNA